MLKLTLPPGAMSTTCVPSCRSPAIVQRVARDLFADGALAATVLGAVNGLQLPPERLALG